MKHVLQYNFMALFMKKWITTYGSHIANNILLSRSQASASIGVEEEIHENGTR